MPTPPYVALDPNAPSGPTQTPPQYSTSDLANVRAIRDRLVSGLGDAAWRFEQSAGGLDPNVPTYYQWVNPGSALILRANMTYAGAPNYQPLTLIWQWSNDAGASFVQIGPSVAFVFDAAVGVITASDSMAGLFTLFIASRAKEIYNQVRINGHMASNGALVHGLGTMATQNANAVAITDGTIANVDVSASNLIASENQGYGRSYPAASSLVNGAVWNWATTKPFCTALNGNSFPGISNVQPGEVKRLYVYGGPITIVGGSVTVFTATGSAFTSGGNVASFLGLDANNVLVSIVNF